MNSFILVWVILKGFKEAGIYEAINDAQEVFERVENPFRA